MSRIHLSRRDLLVLILLTVFWGVNWPIMKIGVNEMPPMSFRALSMAFGLPVLWLLVKSQGLTVRVAREHWGELLAIALTNMVIWFVLAMYGVKWLSSGRAAILGYTMPIWVAIHGFVLFGERPSRQLGFGVLAAAGGVALLLSSEFGTLTGRPLGTLSMLAAAFVWGLGTHLMRRRRQTTHVLVLTFWSLCLSLLVCGGLGLLAEHEDWSGWPSAAGWGAIAYNALIIFGFTQSAWFRIASVLPPIASSLSVMMIPVIGLFSGMLVLGESPHWQDWVALVCILLAIGTVLLPQKDTRPKG